MAFRHGLEKVITLAYGAVDGCLLFSKYSRSFIITTSVHVEGFSAVPSSYGVREVEREACAVLDAGGTRNIEEDSCQGYKRASTCRNKTLDVHLLGHGQTMIWIASLPTARRVQANHFVTDHFRRTGDYRVMRRTVNLSSCRVVDKRVQMKPTHTSASR